MKNQKGFTLIELLIFVAIIIILGLLLASGVARQKATEAWPIKRVKSSETVYSTVVETTTRYTAEDGSSCTAPGDHEMAGKLLQCEWKKAEEN